MTRDTSEDRIVWVWCMDELQPVIGSGIRRVRVADHPRRKNMVKVYPVLDPDAYPRVLKRSEFERLVHEPE